MGNLKQKIKDLATRIGQEIKAIYEDFDLQKITENGNKTNLDLYAQSFRTNQAQYGKYLFNSTYQFNVHMKVPFESNPGCEIEVTSLWSWSRHLKLFIIGGHSDYNYRVIDYVYNNFEVKKYKNTDGNLSFHVKVYSSGGYYTHVVDVKQAKYPNLKFELEAGAISQGAENVETLDYVIYSTRNWIENQNYLKEVNTTNTNSATTSGNGTSSSPIKTDIKVDSDNQNAVDIKTNGIFVNNAKIQYSNTTHNLTFSDNKGNTTTIDLSELTTDIYVDDFDFDAPNLTLKRQGEGDITIDLGELTKITTEDTATIEITGNGLSDSKIKASVKISQDSDNALEAKTTGNKGLYVSKNLSDYNNDADLITKTIADSTYITQPSSPQNGDVIRWDGTKWALAQLPDVITKADITGEDENPKFAQGKAINQAIQEVVSQTSTPGLSDVADVDNTYNGFLRLFSVWLQYSNNSELSKWRSVIADNEDYFYISKISYNETVNTMRMGRETTGNAGTSFSTRVSGEKAQNYDEFVTLAQVFFRYSEITDNLTYQLPITKDNVTIVANVAGGVISLYSPEELSENSDTLENKNIKIKFFEQGYINQRIQRSDGELQENEMLYQSGDVVELLIKDNTYWQINEEQSE